VDDSQREGPIPIKAAPSLAAALRRARVEAADHSQVVAELRGAEIARLEMLADALKPVLAQVPAEIDLFDAGLVSGERPRYFIDMLAFVEMARDRRTYMLQQDTRHGRLLVAESERLDPIVEAATSYIARRLIERDKALASDQTVEEAARAFATAPSPAPWPVNENTTSRGQTPDVSPRRRRGPFATAVGFVVDVLGSVVLIAFLAAALYVLWSVGGQWLATHRGL
jgi:hypothetical protein